MVRRQIEADKIRCGCLFQIPNQFLLYRYKCRCEMKFYNCLTNAKTLPAQVVKELYFSFYGTECYKCDYPAEQCIRYR